MKTIITLTIILTVTIGRISGQSISMYEWEGIKNLSVCSWGTHSDVKQEHKIINKTLNKHTRRFIRKWRSANTLIPKTTKKSIVKGIDTFFAAEYVISDTIHGNVEIKLSKNAISDIIFINGHTFLGIYNLYNCHSVRTKPQKCRPNDIHNYVVCNQRHTKSDLDFAIDFFDRGRMVMSIPNCKDSDHLWFTSNDNRLKIYDKDDIIGKIVNYSQISDYKDKH